MKQPNDSELGPQVDEQAKLCKHGFSTCVLLNITNVKYKKLHSF